MPTTSNDRTFQDRRDSHLKQAQAFLTAAQVRVSDNLPYRTALADAVEAIKHSLQAYLWMRAGALFPRDPSMRFQEVATKGSMPDLLGAVAESGLQLSDVDRRIRELNDLRNQFTHGLPQKGVLITKETADEAIKLADRIDLRVQRAMGLGTATATATATAAAASSPRAPAAATRAPAPATTSGAATRVPSTAGTASAASANAAGSAVKSVPVPANTPAPASATASAAASAAPSVSPAAAPADAAGAVEVSDDASDGSDDIDAPPPRVRPRHFPWGATLAALLTFVLGIALGGTGVYALATGHAPTWLPLPPPLAQLAATPTPSPTATPGATTQPTGPFLAGDLLITPSGCGVVPATLTLRNTSAQPLAWSAGSPDTPGAAFAIATSATSATPTTAGSAHPSLAGVLAPGANVTLSVTGIAPGAAHIVVESSGGSVAVALGAC